MEPTKVAMTARAFSCGTGLCRYRWQTYCLSERSTRSVIRIALPNAIGRTPLTFGSSVPPCPIFSTPRMSRTQAVT